MSKEETMQEKDLGKRLGMRDNSYKTVVVKL